MDAAGAEEPEAAAGAAEPETKGPKSFEKQGSLCYTEKSGKE